MPNVVITGTQWGDEGKGKIVDALTAHADTIVRFQGGNNAGHTLEFDDQKIVVHLVPSGVFHEGKQCVIGNGVVIDPAVLVDEIQQVRELGYLPDDAGLAISPQAHVILPHHKAIDVAREKGLGDRKIGTTGRGIGPAYEDKVARRGVRMVELITPELLRRRLEHVLPDKNLYLERVLEEAPIDLEAVLAEYAVYGEALAPFVRNTSKLLDEARRAGKSILFEGAQGSLLDVDHGTYPFVTSSNTVAGYACVGSGIGPTAIDEVLGISKAYTTRVGEGPLPTELADDVGTLLRDQGDEYGATTGRPRRCGWFDAVVVRHSQRTNGLTGLILTKLDVLSGISPLRICVGYRDPDGREYVDTVPPVPLLSDVEPVYEEIEGWSEPLDAVERIEDLPPAARAYVSRIEELVGTEIAFLSIGPNRKQTIVLRNPFVP